MSDRRFANVHLSGVPGRVWIASASVAVVALVAGGALWWVDPWGQGERWSAFPHAMGCVVDEQRALPPPPAALVKRVLLTHPGGQRVTMVIEFAKAAPPVPQTIVQQSGQRTDAPGSFFYNVELKSNPRAGQVLTIQSPHNGHPWVSDASELDHPDRSTLVSTEATGSAVTLTLDLEDQASFLGQGSFAPGVIVAVVGQQPPPRVAAAPSLIFFSPQSCGWDTPVDSGSGPPPTPAPQAQSPTKTAPPVADPPSGSAPGPRIMLSDADNHGFLIYPGARCDNGDEAALVERTFRSAVVICRTASGGYEYRGSRLSDGATITLPGATPIDGGFAAVNPDNGTRYEVRRDGLTIMENGQSRSEPSVEYGPG